jgi:iron-sulfur cluster repair protein YtfE (RIC family)
MQTTPQINKASIVDELTARYPDTIAVFNRFGIDSCCGGGVPIADAARRDGADFDALLAALRAAVEDR